MNGALIVGDVTGHGRYTLIPSLLALQAEEVARMRVVGGHCITRNLDQMALPRGMDGTWVLAINVQADGNKLAGAADVRLSNGLILSYAIKGSYNPRQETSVLRLVGSGETQGSSLVIKVEGPSMQLTSLTGSVLGQKLKIRE